MFFMFKKDLTLDRFNKTKEIKMELKYYRKKGVTRMRPYVEGEDLERISVSPADKDLETLTGGMIACSPANPDDQWYIAKAYFEENYLENYQPVKDMSLGAATEAALKGIKIARIGWNGSGMFAYIVPAGTYHAQCDIARDHFGDGRGEPNVPYRAYWALKTAQGDIATWAPSGSDSLADDWMIVE